MARPSRRKAAPSRMSAVRWPLRRRPAAASTAAAPTRAVAGTGTGGATPRALVPGGVGGQDQGRDLAGRGARRRHRRGAIGGDIGGAGRGLQPFRIGARDPLDIGVERRVVALVIGRVVADDIDDRRARAAGVVEIGQPIAEPGGEMEQRAGRRAGHARIAVGGAGHHALEQGQHAADALDAVERRHEVHFRGAGIGEADSDAACDQRARQAFGSVHCRFSNTVTG